MSRAAGRSDRIPLHTWALLAALVGSMFSGFWGLLGVPLPLDRVAFAGAVLLLVLDPHRPRLRFQYVYVVMFAVVAWTAASALTHGTLFQAGPAFALLDRIIVPLGMFALGALVFTTTRRRELLLIVFSAVGVYLGLTAVFEIIGPSSLVRPGYIMDESVGILFGRARGPFAGAEANGMTQAMCLFMAALLWSRTRGRTGLRVLAGAAIVCTTLGVALALTRSVWLAVVVAVLGVGLLVPAARRRLPAVVLGTIGFVVVLFAAVPGLGDAFSERLTMQSSIYDRQNTNAAGLRVVAERPLDGVGWQRFVRVVDDWVRQDPNYPLSNVAIEVHNVFLSRAVETGILGAVLWILAVLLGPVAVAARLPRRVPGSEYQGFALLLIALLVVWFVPSMTSPNPYPLPNDLMWLVAGIAGRPELVENSELDDEPDLSRAADSRTLSA